MVASSRSAHSSAVAGATSGVADGFGVSLGAGETVSVGDALGVGSEACLPDGGGTTVGMRPAALAAPAHTVMFADAAYLQGSGAKAKLIEYSFAEPPRFADGGTPWPTIHFRHRGRANVAWADGHVTAEVLDRSGDRFKARELGWFGPDDNTLFDPF